MPKGGSIVQVQQTGAKRSKQKKQGKEGDIAMHLLPGQKCDLYQNRTNRRKQHTIMVLFEPSYGLDCA